MRKDASAHAVKLCSWVLSKGCLRSEKPGDGGPAWLCAARSQQYLTAHGAAELDISSPLSQPHARHQLAAVQACLQTVPAALRPVSALPPALERLVQSDTADAELSQAAGTCYALLPSAAGTRVLLSVHTLAAKLELMRAAGRDCRGLGRGSAEAPGDSAQPAGLPVPAS